MSHDGSGDGLGPPDADEAVWKALAHRLRRRILDELRAGPLPTGVLAERFPASRFVVMQHLQVLREADLVRTRRDGRVRLNILNPVPIQQIHRRWVSLYEQPWAEALIGLKASVEAVGDPEHESEKDVG